MAKTTKRSYNKKSQNYDTSLKGWVKAQPEKILPELLPGAIYVADLDVERLKPAMRVDRVFKIWYRGAYYILHIEFEVGVSMKQPLRLLAYNALLTYEYELPVISIIVYPFPTAMANSPLEITCGDDPVHMFYFRTLPLFTLEAKRYIQQHITCMYPLLPAMHGANAQMIEQAMAELSELYRGDETTLAQEFAWMQVLLEQATIIPDEEKAKLGEKLSMYDPLWEEHPKVKKIKAEAQAQAKAQAQAEMGAKVKEAEAKARTEAEAAIAAVRAEIQAKLEAEAKAEAMREAAKTQLQRAMVYLVKARFPELTELAQQSARQIENPDILSFLLEKIDSAENEAEARGILRPTAA